MLKSARKHARNERPVQPPDRSVEPCVGYWLDDRNSLRTRRTRHGADRPRSLHRGHRQPRHKRQQRVGCPLCSDCCRWKVVNERLQSDPMQTLSVSLDGADAAVHCTRGSSVPSTGEHKKQCTQCSFLCLTNGRTRCAGYGICLDYSGSSQATLMSNRMISDFTH